MILWIILAAIIGVGLHLVVNQLSGTGWNWKAFFISFIPLAVNAAGFGIAYHITGDFVVDFVGALLGGFGLATGITLAMGQKIIRNQVAAMQNPVPKK
jgi:tryptophan-rich sensory protein